MTLRWGGLALLALLTFWRCQVWHSDRTLWASERPTPRQTVNLAQALMLEGSVIEAEQWLMYGLRLSANPNLSERERRIGRVANETNLAVLYGMQGRRIDARLIALDIQRTMPTWPYAQQLCSEFAC
jgi:hypothetical protein